MSFSKATQQLVPIGTYASDAHPAIGRDRSDTDRQLPRSFETAAAFMRSRAEEKREKEDWKSPSDWNIESSHYGDEYDEQYPPEEIIADPSVVDNSDLLSTYDDELENPSYLPPPPPPLTRQNAVCYRCHNVEGSYDTNGLCEDCYNNPFCLHCGMKCDSPYDLFCKEHIYLDDYDLKNGTCGSCKSHDCHKRGYTQLCGYCVHCAQTKQNHLPWTPILSVEPEDQASPPSDYCEMCGSDMHLGYCPDEYCQNTCPECLEDNDGMGGHALCHSCHGYEPNTFEEYDETYTNEYEATMPFVDDLCRLCGVGIDTPCHWCRQEAIV
jgi:hypothetical protein